MRKHQIIISVFFLFIFNSICSYAQTLSNSEARKMNTMILDLIERYEDFAGVYDDDSEYEFLRLFRTPDVSVYAGDLLLGYDTKSSSLPANEYAKQILDYAQNISVNINTVSKGTPYFADNLWYVPISFKKNVEYTDGNVILSSKDYYEEEFIISLLVACNPEEEYCKISEITGRINSDKSFPKQYWVIQEPEESYSKLNLNDMLTSNGEKLNYSTYGYAIVPENSIDAMNEMKYEVRIKADTLNTTIRHKLIAYDFKKTRGRMKIRNKVAPFSAYGINSDMVDAKSWGYELGVDLGFGLPVGATGGSRFGIFVGAAAAYSNLSLSLKEGFSYEYTLEQYDNNSLHSNKTTDNYKFDVNSVEEQSSYTDLMIPLYMSWDHRLGNRDLIWLNWNIGAKTYINLNQLYNLNEYKVNGSIQRNNESVSFANMPKGFIATPDYKKSFIDITAMANAALHIRCSQSTYITLGAGYEIGITRSHKEGDTPYYKKNSVYPFVYSESLDKPVAVHSLFDSTSFRRKALWLDLGVMFKF